MTIKPRVRFAPSPTGPLHIGGVRTALYNYLFAKKHGGTFILRIEDTDQTRFVPGAEEYIIKAFQWLNIPFDEGVHIGGNYGPYRQSERKSMYKQYADQLVAAGHAYYAFDSAESLELKRKEAEAQKKNFQYDSHTRLSLSNSLALPEEEVAAKLAQGEPFVIRFKFPENETIIVDDLVRGTVLVKSNTLDDKVLYKSDGMPTYHLANIVDDHTMEITHVIRGEEWLPSTPLHVMLYQAFGWEAPQFAHLPLLLKPDGNGKLSKRDGDRLGFPVFPLEWQDPKNNEISSGYREKGYLPEAVINMLALLGWNPGTEQELMTREEMVELFSIEKINKSGSKFDPEKAKWFNHQYIKMLPDETLAAMIKDELSEKNIVLSPVQWTKLATVVKERLNFTGDVWEQSYFLFQTPESYDEQVVKHRWKEDIPSHLNAISALLLSMNQPFDKEKAHDKVLQYILNDELNMGQIMNCLRLSLVGASKGPDLFDIIDFLGVEEVVKRIKTAIAAINI
ncbi:MAG: glutamate--tRNA ligase [Bacteroidales bacterium]|jgi:glutamyl-tRNA synthetase|nr:glutamate--tRNA ligase [Bacteroidales bacterium]